MVITVMKTKVTYDEGWYNYSLACFFCKKKKTLKKSAAVCCLCRLAVASIIAVCDTFRIMLPLQTILMYRYKTK